MCIRDSDESDWSDEDDEPEVIREKHYQLGNKLMELGVKDVKGLELIFNVDKEGVLRVAARDLKTNNVVKGEL